MLARIIQDRVPKAGEGIIKNCNGLPRKSHDFLAMTARLDFDAQSLRGTATILSGEAIHCI